MAKLKSEHEGVLWSVAYLIVLAGCVFRREPHTITNGVAATDAADRFINTLQERQDHGD